MKIKKSVILYRIFLLACVQLCMGFFCYAQNRNSLWLFGDSAGIDFTNLAQPVPLHSAVKSRGSCMNVCDANGNLLFYAYTYATLPGNTTTVKDATHNVMQNGTNVVGRGWYYELCIVPDPADINKYYLFSIGVGGSAKYGFRYSTIDMNLNNGLGAVVQKNITLLPYPASDGLTCVKHGNGRDWWLLVPLYGNDVTYLSYLITPDTIELKQTHIFPVSGYEGGTACFSPDGSKYV